MAHDPHATHATHAVASDNETGFGYGIILSIVMAVLIFGLLLLSHRG